VAENSYKLFKNAVSPSGLFNDMVQPEIKSLYPDLNMIVFSPNDTIQINNSCTIAESITEGEPLIAEKTLKFSLNQQTLYRYYYGSQGKKILNCYANIPEFTSLARLAARLHNTEATEEYLAKSLPFWQMFARNPYEPKVYMAGEILLAIITIEETGDGSRKK
jgi:hypothetical protein